MNDVNRDPDSRHDPIEPTPEQIQQAENAAYKAVTDNAELAKSLDIDPSAVAALVGLNVPSEELVGDALTDIAQARHDVYCELFKQLLPVHTALMEVAGRNTADHIVMDIFMNSLALTMANFGDSPLGD